MSVRMAEVTESVCMMSAAYRGGPPLSTHILCLLGIWPAGRNRLNFAEDAMYGLRRGESIVAIRCERALDRVRVVVTAVPPLGTRRVSRPAGRAREIRCGCHGGCFMHRRSNERRGASTLASYEC